MARRHAAVRRDLGPEAVADARGRRAAAPLNEGRAADNGLHFTMAPVVEQRIEPAFKPAALDVRRSGRLAAVVELAPDPPPADDTVFVVPASVDQEIRRGCWLGGRYM